MLQHRWGSNQIIRINQNCFESAAGGHKKTAAVDQIQASSQNRDKRDWNTLKMTDELVFVSIDVMKVIFGCALGFALPHSA